MDDKEKFYIYVCISIILLIAQAVITYHALINERELRLALSLSQYVDGYDTVKIENFFEQHRVMTRGIFAWVILAVRGVLYGLIITEMVKFSNHIVDFVCNMKNYNYFPHRHTYYDYVGYREKAAIGYKVVSALIFLIYLYNECSSFQHLRELRPVIINFQSLILRQIGIM